MPFTNWFKKEIGKLTRRFLWDCENTAPVSQEFTTSKPCLGGLGLIKRGEHCKAIYSKLVATMLVSHIRGPHAARAVNWAVNLGAETCRAWELAQTIANKRQKERLKPTGFTLYLTAYLKKSGWTIRCPWKPSGMPDWNIDPQMSNNIQENKTRENMWIELEVLY